MTSIMQYHHHDCDGNIFIHMTTFEDLVIGTSKQTIEHCNHTHTCPHNQHGQHNESCSMHLGDYKASEPTTIITGSMMIPILLFIRSNKIGLPEDIPTDILGINDEHYNCNIKEFTNTISALRAPPMS